MLTVIILKSEIILKYVKRVYHRLMNFMIIIYMNLAHGLYEPKGILYEKFRPERRKEN